MIGKGTSQRLRGKKQNSTRYTGIILDDFESELNTKTPDSRRQIKEWVTAAVYPAIDFDKQGFLWCNGTIVHYDSFLNGLVNKNQEAINTGEDFAWSVYTKKAIEDGAPLWPSRWPMKKIEERKQFYIDSGTPAKFYQEYMNQAKSPEDQIFSEEDINNAIYKGNARYDGECDSWYIKLDDGRKEYVNIYIGVDPASTLGQYNDYSVIMVIGVTSEFDYYVIEYWQKRVLPMDCADKIFDIAKRYSPIRRINIETVAYQEMLRDYVMKRSKSEGVFLPGIEKGIKNYNQKKKDRLFEGLQPMFKAGAVHLKKDMHEFIGELIDFPKGSHDDTIDAFWLATQFAKGNPKAGNVKRKKNKDGTWYKPKKMYNWMTGARK
jgi:predicted phage terminase large subunit-like protein